MIKFIQSIQLTVDGSRGGRGGVGAVGGRILLRVRLLLLHLLLSIHRLLLLLLLVDGLLLLRLLYAVVGLLNLNYETLVILSDHSLL